GNPVSALVCALLFVRPALAKLQGLAEAGAANPTARLAKDLPANDRRQDYLRATLAHGADGTLEATPFYKQDSSMMSLLARADCLVVRPPNAPAAKKGASVEVVLLGPNATL
ncbi:MAG: molybdopterin molybdenumtransferase MoeA, partial [Stellaceae bacterium]